MNPRTPAGRASLRRIASAPGLTLLSTLALALLGALALAGPARADLCVSQGTGAGQCVQPAGVAADLESERVFVTDSETDRVNAFAPDGEFLFAFGWGVRDGAAEAQSCGPEATPPSADCQAGLPGGGAGQFNSPRAIAVDNVEASGSVYVYDALNRRVQKFDSDGNFLWMVGKEVNSGTSGEANLCTNAGPPTDVCGAGESGTGPLEFKEPIDLVAVGPGGELYVSDMVQFSKEPRLLRISAAGGFVGECEPAHDERLNAGFAVDATGAIYAGYGTGGGIFRFESGEPKCAEAGAPYPLDPAIDLTALTIGAADELLASQREPRVFGGGVHQVISSYDPSGSITRRFGYDQIGGGPNGLAYLPTPAGDVFASESSFGDSKVPYLPFPPPGPIAVPSSPEVATIRAINADIRAEVNPGGEVTDAFTQYVDRESYEAEGFEGPAVKTGPAQSLPASFEIQGVEGLAGCEVPADYEDPEETKDCLAPETEYRWRVVAENASGKSIAEAEEYFQTPEHIEAIFAAEVGSETARIGARIDPLGILTTARMQYVDDASFKATGFEEAIAAPDPEAAPLDYGEGLGATERSVELYPLEPRTTYRYRVVATDPLEEFLGEQVGSFTTGGPEAPLTGCANDATRTGPAAYLPDCRAYEMVSPVDKNGGEIKVQLESFTSLPARLDQAAVSGDRLTYGSYRAFADALSAPYTSQYLAQREAGGWFSHAINPPQDGLVKGSVELDNEYEYFSPDLCEGWLTAFAEYPEDIGQALGYQNIFKRSDQLCGTEGYEPITTTPPVNDGPNGFSLELQGVSDDGETAAFIATDALAGTGAPAAGGDRRLYVKEVGGELRFACVLPGGAASKEACSAGSSRGVTGNVGASRLASVTNALSADGRSLYWTDAGGDGPIYLRTDPLGEGAECAGEGTPCTVAVTGITAHFWAGASDGSAAIYTTGGLEAGNASVRRYDAESGESTTLAGQAFGVVGVSEDASRVYLVSREALDPEPSSWGDEATVGEPNLYLADAGVGTTRFIATLSDADANPFPKAVGASTAVGVEPITHNGRATADGAHAAFMSSAPLTGYDNTDAASGAADTEAFVYDAGADRLRCASCDPSGGRPSGAARLPVYESTLYAPRVLAEDGSRLYFESADSLVGRDSNAKIDVYQWEETGAGGCEAASPTHSPAAGGCIDLISSGQGGIDAAFLDASPSGADVFFTTAQSLYPADPGLVDVYDARIGGGFAPPPAPAPECEGEQCQNPPPAPGFQTPSSRAFQGPAGLPAPSPAAGCNRTARRAKRLAGKAKRMRRAARRAKAPAARRGRIRAARRSARQARKLSRSAKRCRARARAARRSSR